MPRRRLGRSIATVLLVAGAVTAGLAWAARRPALQLVENPLENRHLPGRTPIDYGMVYDEVAVTTADGLRLVGWYVPPKNRAIVLAQHGYKADRGEMLNEAAMLHRHGFGVLISSLRAHDLSDGTIITFGARERLDLDAWFEFARSQPEVDPDRVGVLGNSLGGSLVIELAARTPGVRAVAAQSAFSSMADTLEKSVRFFTGLPPFPFAPLIAFWAERHAGVSIDEIDTRRLIGRISPRPVLLMQGGADVVISTDSGRRLFDAAGQPKELWFEPSLGHARFDTARPEEFERRLVQFFDHHLLGAPAGTPGRDPGEPASPSLP
jgi:fermentation-respiration switch protein FrsA (DUF1100 family)